MFFRILVLLLCTSFVFSQSPGSLDVTYGTNGISGHTLTINNVLHGLSVRDFHILPNNKILAVGIAQNGCSSTQNQFGFIIRLNNDGSLDTTFNNGGYILFSNYFFQSITPLNNEIFLIVSNSHLLKIDSEGNLDVSFGNDGFLFLNLQAFKAISTQNGKILIGGRKMNSSAQWEVALTQINLDGTLDNNFGNNGLVIIPHQSGASTTFGGIHIDNQNRVLLACRRQVSQNNGKIIVFRLTQNGDYDNSFATNGMYFEDFHFNARTQDVKTTSDGKIVIAGNGQLTSFGNHGLILIQLNENGTLNTNFATNGRVHLPIYSESTANCLHILIDGSIVVTGGYESSYVAKFNSQGIIAADFGENGVVNQFLFDWTGFNTTSKIIDNKILLAANTAFAHCAQQKYEALFVRFFLSSESLEISTPEYGSFELYPNPVTEKLFIKSLDKIELVEIFSTNGKIMNLKSEFTEGLNVADLSSLSSGVYIVKISTKKDFITKYVIKK
ncbi:MAG: T9SS type A sorting domain-containing protein [Flavobacterium sp.]|nr:T9SS type A sorting domain-containing protein [Flavobacterium sp.]